jgi:hypothetical protein
LQDTAIPKKMMYGKLYATRRRGRPKTRWLDDVSTDVRKMGINGAKGLILFATCFGRPDKLKVIKYIQNTCRNFCIEPYVATAIPVMFYILSVTRRGSRRNGY